MFAEVATIWKFGINRKISDLIYSCYCAGTEHGTFSVFFMVPFLYLRLPGGNEMVHWPEMTLGAILYRWYPCTFHKIISMVLVINNLGSSNIFGYAFNQWKTNICVNWTFIPYSEILQVYLYRKNLGSYLYLKSYKKIIHFSHLR